MEGVIDVSLPNRGERTLLQALFSMAGATAVALLLPVTILLVGVPVALAARSVLEAIRWLLGVGIP